MLARAELQGVSATASRSRMRVVIADSDTSQRHFLRQLLLKHSGYEIVGEAGSGEECAEMVTREFPELTICSACCAPQLSDEPGFPLLITLASAGAIISNRVVCDVPAPLREAALAEALALASARILQIKLGDLSVLIDAYLREEGAPLQTISVEDDAGRQLDISPGDVLWIKAAGNYVQLYTRNAIFELRDTISSIAARLERSGFVRIHRASVVNSSAIRCPKTSNGVVTEVVLTDGTELLVGPNFRQHLTATLEYPASGIAATA